MKSHKIASGKKRHSRERVRNIWGHKLFEQRVTMCIMKNDENYKIIIMETIHVNDMNLSRSIACLHQIDSNFFFCSPIYCYLLNLINETMSSSHLFVALWLFFYFPQLYFTVVVPYYCNPLSRYKNVEILACRLVVCKNFHWKLFCLILWFIRSCDDASFCYCIIWNDGDWWHQRKCYWKMTTR